ncbi:NADP oxidoreductase [Babesia caballi]|uniref:NADP oxidoreductase n=1 Tax=Babesia caballi TaxID=5871 RepID=A0AAV4LPC6_BABCB|nr:NADP oxidoreductase [Babesia caballi]
METQYLRDVVVSYCDPFDIWEEIKPNLHSILPLPVNVKKINATNWNRHNVLPQGMKTEFKTGGSFFCSYVKATDIPRLDSRHTEVVLRDAPYLYIYVLPPMDHEFFKQNAKGSLKSFLSASKGKRIVVIYGICKKENVDQQKVNCKTIGKIRSMLASMSVSQNRLCLVPMLGLPVLNVNGTPLVDEEPEEDADVNSAKNWENLGLVMSDSISETVAAKLLEIAAVSHKTKTHSPYSFHLFCDSVLRTYVKCGLILDAVDGYMSLIRNIELDVKTPLTPKDMRRTPFLSFTGSVLNMDTEMSSFSIYQYLCYTAIRLLEQVNSVSGLFRACIIFLDWCTVAFIAVRRNLCTSHLLWLSVIINGFLSYINERVQVLSEHSELLDVVVRHVTHEYKSPKTSTIGKLRATMRRKRSSKMQYASNNDNFSDQNSSPADRDINDTEMNLTHDHLLHTSPECIKQTNTAKSIRRCMGLLYTYLYKTLKNLDTLILRGERLDVTRDEVDDSSSKGYTSLVMDMWEKVKDVETRKGMLSEAIENSAVNFSHGDLARFSNVMASLSDNDSDLSSMEKDCSSLGWSIRGVKSNTGLQVFLWFDVHEPNMHLKDPLGRVKSVLCNNLDNIGYNSNICLTPSHIEDEAVNDYLRILAEAKMDIGTSSTNFQTYGQLMKFATPTCSLVLNVYSMENCASTTIRVRLREDQEQMVEGPRPSVLHDYEELTLANVKMVCGLNVYHLKHTFSKPCNYTLDSFIVDVEGFQITQRPYAPIPLGILSGVIKAAKAQKVRGSHLLSALVLPTTFIQCSVTESITLTARPCSDAPAQSNSVLLAGVRNYTTFYLSGFSGGRICLLKSNVRYDIEHVSLYSNGVKVGVFGCSATSEGVALDIPENGSSNHVICIAATLDADFNQDRVKQDVVVSGSNRPYIRLEFMILPPFCREVTTTDNAILQVVLEPTALFYTQIDCVTVNGRVLVGEPTLLERGSHFCITLDENDASNDAYRTKSFHRSDTHSPSGFCTLEDLKAQRVSNHLSSTGSVDSGIPIYGLPKHQETPSPSNASEERASSKISVMTEKEVVVKYRIFRRKCPHQHSNVDDGLEALSAGLEYCFTVPQAAVSDVVVEYNTPPFCFPGTLFEARITIRTTREVSFEYELETSDNWFVEGPVRGKNQELGPLGSMQLRFKMMALECAGGGAGPCGLYLAKNLRGRVSPCARIDIFDRLPQALGLLRFGVAPDSLSVRRSADTLLARTNERFFFNLRVGTDLGIEELMRYYHVCILSCGAESPRPFPIPGDDSEGVFDSLDIIRWYNSHPEAPRKVQDYFRRLAALGRRVNACVIGNGNVSLDIARILLTPAKQLEHTDIDKAFLECLSKTDVNAVSIVGRRGIFQASFTNSELRRIAETIDFVPFTDQESLECSLAHQPLVLDRRMHRRLSLFSKIARNSQAASSAQRTLEFTFFRTVHSIERGDDSAIAHVVLEKNVLDECGNAKATGHRIRVPSDMLVKCIGFQRSSDSENLLKHVDSKRIFHCELVALDDCDGLMFQHGPHLEFGFDAKEDGSIRIQVSNRHDIVFIAQSKRIYIYRLSSLVSSAVANEPYDTHLLDTITFEHVVDRIHVLPEYHLLACQSALKVVVYDFSQGIIKFESDFTDPIDSVQWSNQCLLVRDTSNVLHSLSLDGSRKTLMSNCQIVSPVSADGFHIACRYDGILSVQMFKDVPDPSKFIPLELPSDYDSSSVTEVAGCHVISEDMAAIGLVIDSQDSLLVLCHYTKNSAVVTHWALNELFLSAECMRTQIEFLWVKEWQCLFAWSNAATMVVVLSRHENLVSDGGWHVINMKEGYCLESVDIDCCPSDLVVCTSYRDKLYRKKASADAPLLTNPPVFLLAQGSNTVAVHYADIWLIDSDLNEIEGLPKLGDENDGSLFSSFTLHRGTQIACAMANDTAKSTMDYRKESPLEDLFSCFKVDSPMDVKHAQASVNSRLNDSNGTYGHALVGKQTESSIDRCSENLPGAKTYSKDTPFTIGDRTASRENPSKMDGEFSRIEKLYHEAVRNYERMDVEDERKLERIRLVEMLCNCFHIFENRLSDFEAVHSSDYIAPATADVDHWCRKVEEMKRIQKEIVQNINHTPHNIQQGHNTLDLPDEMVHLYEKTAELYASNFHIAQPEVELGDMERHLNGVMDALKSMNQRLDEYEAQLLSFENMRALSYKTKVTPPRDADVCSNDTKFKIFEINDLIEQLKRAQLTYPSHLDIEYKEVGMKYNDYTTLAKRGFHKDASAATTCTNVSGVQKCNVMSDRDVPEKGKQPQDNAHFNETSCGRTEPGGIFVNSGLALNTASPDSNDRIIQSTASDSRRDTADSSPVKSENRISSNVDRHSTTVNGGLGSSLSPKSSVLAQDTFGTADLISKKEEPKSPTTVSEPFQRQSCSFGDEGTSSQFVLSGGLQVQAPISTGSTPFSLFASKSPVSFADLALSKSIASPANGDGEPGSLTKAFGGSTFTAFKAAGGFTGMSGFTTGNFQPSNFQSVLPAHADVAKTAQSDSYAKNSLSPTTAPEGDIWNSCRRSNPLD